MIDYTSITPDAICYPAAWALPDAPKPPAFVIPSVSITGTANRAENLYGTRAPNQLPSEPIITMET